MSKKVETEGIDELLNIYIKFNAEAKEHPELMDEARDWFVKMEQNDEEALEIWKWFKEISMVEFERVYNMLDISFDSCLITKKDGGSIYHSRDIAAALYRKDSCELLGMKCPEEM